MTHSTRIIVSITLIAAAAVLTACTPPNPQETNITLDSEQLDANQGIDPSTVPQSSSYAIQQPSTTLQQGETVNNQSPISASQATITTSKGDVVVQLYADTAPGTVQNFLQKAKSEYYQGLTFHRVEDWVVQGGDPLGNGTGGGPLPTELSDVPFKEGSLGVARGGNIEISNDSQFFICTKDCSWLTGQYTNFGEVVSGMDIVKAIEIGDTIEAITYEE